MFPNMTLIRRDSLPPEILQELRPYVATRDWQHNEGTDIHHPRLTLNIRKGDTFEYAQGILVLFNRVHEIQNISSFEAILANGWAEQTGGEVDMAIQRAKEVRGLVRKAHRPSMDTVQAQQAQQQVEQGPRKELRGLVQIVGGAEMLPDDWEEKDWSFKRAYISQMTDASLLDDMLFDADERVARFINKRLEVLSGGSPVHMAAPAAPVDMSGAPRVVVNDPTQPKAPVVNTAPPQDLPPVNTANLTDEQKAVAELMARQRAKAAIPRQDPPKTPPKFKAASPDSLSESSAYSDEGMEGEEFIEADFEPGKSEPELAATHPVTRGRRGRPAKNKGTPMRNSDYVDTESGTIEISEAFDDIEGPNGEKITGF